MPWSRASVEEGAWLCGTAGREGGGCPLAMWGNAATHCCPLGPMSQRYFGPAPKVPEFSKILEILEILENPRAYSSDS